MCGCVCGFRAGLGLGWFSVRKWGLRGVEIYFVVLSILCAMNSQIPFLDEQKSSTPPFYSPFPFNS